jgi:hypothetical protein
MYHVRRRRATRTDGWPGCLGAYTHTPTHPHTHTHTLTRHNQSTRTSRAVAPDTRDQQRPAETSDPELTKVPAYPRAIALGQVSVYSRCCWQVRFLRLARWFDRHMLCGPLRLFLLFPSTPTPTRSPKSMTVPLSRYSFRPSTPPCPPALQPAAPCARALARGHHDSRSRPSIATSSRLALDLPQ